MVCLETTFLVDFLRGNLALEAALDEWEASNKRVTIPAPALAEVAFGVEMEKTGRERKLLEKICSRFVVLHLTERSAMRAGKIDAELTEAGETIGLIDAMIAAVALEHEEVLVTRNLKHFERIPNLEVQGY